MFLSFGDAVTGIVRSAVHNRETKAWEGTAAMLVACLVSPTGIPLLDGCCGWTSSGRGSPWTMPSGLRQECLNETWLLSLEDAREKVESWRLQYNRERPHGALGNLAPLEFASAVATVQ